MKFNIIQKIQQSLFIKIILIFLVAYLVFTASQAAIHQYLFKSIHFTQIQRNSANYASYIIEEIGTTPDTLIARQISQKLGIGIRIKSSDLNWTSKNDMRTFNEVDIPRFNDKKNIRAGLHKGLYIDIEKENVRYLFAMEKREQGFSYMLELHLIIMISVTTMLLFVIYLILRWQLKPIRTLHSGVTELSKGDLDVHISTKRRDELGQLIISVNEMISKIKERIHARDQLLLDVSHELRSPITRIKIALEFLEDENVKKNISGDIGEMETMVTEILETERLKSSHGGVQLEKIELVQIINEVTSEFSNSNPGIKLLNFPDSIDLAADADRIRILLRNIIDNALKYSKKDGYPVEVSLREKSNELIIEVQDFGQGIPEKEIPFVFEPFYRVDKSRSKETGGYGLGMNMSRQIMEAHGGTIDISSKMNVGTIVFIKFRT